MSSVFRRVAIRDWWASRKVVSVISSFVDIIFSGPVIKGGIFQTFKSFTS
jgi:hypothetical protein